MQNPIPLANEYYLHQVDSPDKTHLMPGNRINNHFIYDVVYQKQPSGFIKVFYISKEKNGFSENFNEKIIFDQTNDIIDKFNQHPKIVFCDEYSLSALFFYFRRFYKNNRHQQPPLIIIQSSQLLPFHPVPSKIIVPQLPPHVIAAVPYFEDLNIPSRIASVNLSKPGWYDGDLRHYFNKNSQAVIESIAKQSSKNGT